MGFNPLKLLGAAAETIGGVFGLDLSIVTDALKSGDLTPEQRTALQEHEVALKEIALEELKTEIDAKVDLMKTEIQSGDKFVRRARPTGLYISYVIILGLVAAVIAGQQIDVGEILSLTGPIMGYSGWYVYNRTKDKRNGSR